MARSRPARKKKRQRARSRKRPTVASVEAMFANIEREFRAASPEDRGEYKQTLLAELDAPGTSRLDRAIARHMLAAMDREDSPGVVREELREALREAWEPANV